MIYFANADFFSDEKRNEVYSAFIAASVILGKRSSAKDKTFSIISKSLV